MPRASRLDLENALGKALVTQIFDDDNDGVIEDGAMQACLEYGDSEVDSFIYGQYSGQWPIASDLPALKFAAIDFCCAYAARRRPELARSLGSEPWKGCHGAAVEKMTRFLKGQQRLPAPAPAPANVTSVVKVGGAIQPDDLPDRVFDDMGDF